MGAKFWTGIGTAVFIVFVGAVVLTMWGCPKYNVYVKKKRGEASLKEAEYQRRTLVETARAKKDAARFLAAAEVERAKGVAEANKIIGDSLKGNEAYLRYRWIMGLQDGNSEVIYVPTEANLPILEANRKKWRKNK